MGRLHDARCARQPGGDYNRVAPSETLSIIKEDPDDDRILECADAEKSDFIISEDKDLLRLGHHGRARIVTVREFMKLALTPGKRR